VEQKMKILKKTGIILISLIGVVFIYFFVVIFAPGFSIPKQPINKVTQKAMIPPPFREDVSYKVGDAKINAWLYLPENRSSPVPCVIMSNGFGGTKGEILESYAIRFRNAGLAVIIYDYRHFGESEGEPRQLFSSAYQIEDLKASIKFARNRKKINPDKIALWGTSAGGGYGLIIAADDKKIAAIVGQCPGLGGKADEELFLKQNGIGFMLRLLMHAQRDKGRSWFGLSQHLIPIVGKPGTFAFLSTPGAFEGYSKLISGSYDVGFKNEVSARSLLMPTAGEPVDFADRVQSPVLLQIAEKDNLASPEAAHEVAKIMGAKAELKIYPIGHFDFYTGKGFEKAVADQIAFFRKHLF